MTDRDEDFYAELNDDSPPYSPIDDPASKHSHDQTTAGESGRIEASDASGGEIEDMANAALKPIEAAGARWADWSAREYLREVYGIDASEYADDAALLEAMDAADADDSARPENEPTFEVQGSSASLGSGEDRIEASRGTAERSEAVADSVLTPAEAAEVEAMNTTAMEYIEAEFGVNAARFNDEARLLKAVSDARGGQ